jgi:colanic acid biosynthesis glycosyl transferase WcaI
MHILFLSHYFPPEVNAPATRTFEHASRWVSQGHDVTVITCAPNCPTGVVFDGYRNAWHAEETVNGIRVIRVWTYLSANKGFVGRILNFLSYMAAAVWCALWLRNVDLVVATSPQFFCGWAGVLCHWLRRWPFVLEIRDIWPESIVTVGAMKRSPLMAVLEWLERRMYAAADHIVTVGNGYRDQLLARRVPAEKISVIPNGVDVQRFQPQPANAELRRQWNGDGKFVCAYIGTVGMAHGLDVVLKAAELLKCGMRNAECGMKQEPPAALRTPHSALRTPSVQFWIVGDGAERAALEQAAKDRQLDSITFTGMIPKQQIDDVIASVDACLVHLRGTELFGTVIPSKVFETMALNIPIIMGVRGQAQDIVLDGNGGVAMTPDDPESLLAGIEAIRTDRQRFCQGRKFVAQHYDRTQLADEMLGTLLRFGEPAKTLPVEAQPDVRRAA